MLKNLLSFTYFSLVVEIVSILHASTVILKVPMKSSSELKFMFFFGFGDDLFGLNAVYYVTR